MVVTKDTSSVDSLRLREGDRVIRYWTSSLLNGDIQYTALNRPTSHGKISDLHLNATEIG